MRKLTPAESDKTEYISTRGLVKVKEKRRTTLKHENHITKSMTVYSIEPIAI